MKILISGGVGFIGTNCAIYFAHFKNYQVTLIDNFSREGVSNNAKFLIKNYPKIKIIKSDIINIKNYLPILKKADVVLHLAGQTAVTTSIKDPMGDFKNNLLGSFYLLEAIRKYNPTAALLYSSTNKLYGDLRQHNLVKNLKKKKYEDICHPDGLDENEKLDFISPYGCSKGAVDLYCQDYARIYNLNTIVFRQSCIYGPHQIGVEDQGWVAHFVKQFLLKKSITIFGDGYQARDLLYIDDLISAFDLGIKKIKKIKGEVYNIGGGVKNSYSLLQIIALLEKKFGYKIPIKFASSRLGDQQYFVSSNQKIKKILGWAPETKFESGIEKLINWQKKTFL